MAANTNRVNTKCVFSRIPMNVVILMRRSSAVNTAQF